MTDLPDKLPGHWMTAHGAEMAREYADKKRASLCGGDITDLQVANDVYLHPSIMALTVAKDRIRWLSVQLALANMDKVQLANALGFASRVLKDKGVLRLMVGDTDIMEAALAKVTKQEGAE